MDRSHCKPGRAHFLLHLTGSPLAALDAALLRRWMADPWPGNVRQLRNEVERVALLHPGALMPGRRGTAPVRPSVASTPEVATPAGPANVAIPGTRAARQRRRALLDLLRRSPDEVHVADAAAHCGSAPATAARDLAVLVDLGLVKRVITSANLRTSHFVRADDRT